MFRIQTWDTIIYKEDLREESAIYIFVNFQNLYLAFTYNAIYLSDSTTDNAYISSSLPKIFVEVDILFLTIDYF